MQKRSSLIVRLISATMVSGTALFAVPSVYAQAAQPASGVEAVGEAAAVSLTAKIVNVFPDTNAIALEGPKGNTVEIVINKSVADVNKLHVGDTVHAEYRAALLLSADKVDPKGQRSRDVAQAVQPASDGVVVKATGVQVVAVIDKIDVANREVTLSGPERAITLKVPKDVPLEKFKVGDDVLATYLAATAVTVTRNGKLVK
jgi:hypothetical protein